MSLTPISKITVEIQAQPGWEGVRDWGLIVKAWNGTVSLMIANHTQPRSISREILTIATNSSSLAHQLTFGRQALCQQLNHHLITPVPDATIVGASSTGRHRTFWDGENLDINNPDTERFVGTRLTGGSIQAAPPVVQPSPADIP